MEPPAHKWRLEEVWRLTSERSPRGKVIYVCLVLWTGSEDDDDDANIWNVELFHKEAYYLDADASVDVFKVFKDHANAFGQIVTVADQMRTDVREGP